MQGSPDRTHIPVPRLDPEQGGLILSVNRRDVVAIMIPPSDQPQLVQLQFLHCHQGKNVNVADLRFVAPQAIRILREELGRPKTLPGRSFACKEVNRAQAQTP